jgi:hypothetical protein
MSGNAKLKKSRKHAVANGGGLSPLDTGPIIDSSDRMFAPALYTTELR